MKMKTMKEIARKCQDIIFIVILSCFLAIWSSGPDDECRDAINVMLIGVIQWDD